MRLNHGTPLEVKPAAITQPHSSPWWTPIVQQNITPTLPGDSYISTWGAPEGAKADHWGEIMPTECNCCAFA